MKRFTFLLLLATFATMASAEAQMNGVTPSQTPAGDSATDAAVAAMSTIKRPRADTPAPASGPAKPLEASLSKDEKGQSTTTTFASDSPKIYLQWSDAGATKGEKLRVVWIAESTAGSSTKNKKLTESAGTLPGPGSYGSFFLKEPAGGFAVGKYRVDLYENAKLAKTLKFTVTK
jgi:hypothetical protein